METLLNNLASLVTAKSLMAICLTIVFAWQSVPWGSALIL